MSTMARTIFMEVLEAHLGRWYSWGGDDPSGFDCSGLIVEGLKSVGKLQRGMDVTAHGLCHHLGFTKVTVDEVQEGCLIFWGTDDKIVHVEAVLEILEDGTVLTIGASGGGSRTRTKEDAMRDNAFVKIRPAKPGIVAAVDPFS